MYQVVSKLKALKKHLRKLVHDHGNLHERVNRLRHELDEQKSKIEWLDVGDSNSAYFHKSIKSRNQRSRIEVILNADNVLVSGPKVPNVFVQHYEKFLGTDMACDELNYDGLFQKQVSEQACSFMIRPLTNSEIKTAMFSIGGDKALGLDGYTSAFFKKGWDILGQDVCKAVHDFFINGHLLKEINHTFIALIPKVPTPHRVNDYRPISCCNVIYKCISKIITNRIIEGIKEVVSDNQSAFVPGRRISDNILLTQELMYAYHRDIGPPRCDFKIDIQKAYDMADWRFMGIILKQFGFPPLITKWIMACVSSTSFSIGVNGDIHGFFRRKRGLRQGDPLSLYLFTLVMEVLTLILQRRVRESDSFRFHKYCEDLQIINVCFADDLFIFARGDVDSAWVIRDSLEEFTRVSGLVQSLPKSTTFFCNVANHVKLAILNTMPFAEGKLHVIYLGVPLIPTRLFNRDCKFLVEKARNRISDWKNKSLSFSGRLQLCNSVISSMHAYWASVLMIPTGILLDIEQLMRGFLWCNGDLKRGKAKVAWNTICLPKCEGGLGIRSPRISYDSGTCVLVWTSIRYLAGMDTVPSRIEDIVSYLQPIAHQRTVFSVIGRLLLATSAYYMWDERNKRGFKQAKRSWTDIRDIIITTIYENDFVSVVSFKRASGLENEISRKTYRVFISCGYEEIGMTLYAGKVVELSLMAMRRWVDPMGAIDSVLEPK
nr:hypothetical protein [Tanacetum cinerariifolium]